MSLLRTTGLSVTYGGVRAVDAVDVTVEAGQIVGLVGPNGAGKSSLIDAITGFTPASGRVEFNGRDISNMAPHRRVTLGMGRTWQTLDLFNDLSVADNLAVSAERDRSILGYVRDLLAPRPREMAGRVEQVLEMCGIVDLRDRWPQQLSHGQRQLVSVARALAAKPVLVCLDEPAAGLDSDETGELGRMLRRLAADGIAILLIDHDMQLILDVCDHIDVLEFGRTIASGTPEEIAADARVASAYLGSGRRETS
jgi:branched-chain amino acid transport system ATP-binding protein